MLVETSPYDNTSGAFGFQPTPRRQDPRVGGGKNLLGFALMEVCCELFRITQNENVKVRLERSLR